MSLHNLIQNTIVKRMHDFCTSLLYVFTEGDDLKLYSGNTHARKVVLSISVVCMQTWFMKA